MYPDFEHGLKLLADYGISIVISAIFLYLCIRVINISMNYLENNLHKRFHKDKLDLRQEIGSKVQQMITEFIEDHHGERIQVIEFSNSITSIAYLPFKYMSCTYEVCSPDRKSVGQRMDRLSTSLFTTFLDNLQDVDYCMFDLSTHDKLVGGAMYDLMKDMQETQCLCSMMKSIDERSIGYIAFYKDSEFTDSDKSDIQTLSKSIQSLLCVLENK